MKISNKRKGYKMNDKVYKIIDKVKEEWSNRADLTSYEKALVRVICSEIKAEVAHEETVEFLNGMDK